MARFLVVALAQFVSLLGSQLTSFGLVLWLYQRTGSTTVYGVGLMATFGPLLMLMPLAGALVDRWSPRRAMLVGHAGAAAFTLLAVILWLESLLSVPVAVVLMAGSSAFNALHTPALSVAMTLLVEPEELGRANGVLQFQLATAAVVAPAVAARMLAWSGFGTILAIDVVSFLFALGVISAISLPQAAGQRQRRVADALWAGWRHVRAFPGLVVLLGVAALINFNVATAQVLIAPLVLGFADLSTLGTIMSVGTLGYVAGAIALLAWGAPRNLVGTILLCLFLQSVFLVLGGVHAASWSVALAAFVPLLSLALAAGASHTLWQRKVPPRIQGSVFAVRSCVTLAAMPFAFVFAGPIADRLFEPAMARDGALASSVGVILGVGPGRGAALLLVLVGLTSFGIALLAARSPRLRQLERTVPDHWIPEARSLHPATSIVRSGEGA